jgi:hypothetical protein
VTKPEDIAELRHPSTDVLDLWPEASVKMADIAGLRAGRAGVQPDNSRIPAADSLRLLWREQCRKRWRAGVFLSLSREAREMADLLLEDLGLMPDPFAEDRKVAEEILARARQRAFQDASNRMQENGQMREPKWLWVLPRRVPDRPADATLESIPSADEFRTRERFWLSQAGVELELAILAALLVFAEYMDSMTRGPPGGQTLAPEWIRYALEESWRLLPPRWIQGRVTRHECRLGTERIPAGVVLFFCPHLLNGAMDFEHFELASNHTEVPLPRCSEGVWGETMELLGLRTLRGISVLFEEIFAHRRLGPVPGQEDWQLWERRDSRALIRELPFHVT